MTRPDPREDAFAPDDEERIAGLMDDDDLRGLWAQERTRAPGWLEKPRRRKMKRSWGR